MSRHQILPTLFCGALLLTCLLLSGCTLPSSLSSGSNKGSGKIDAEGAAAFTMTAQELLAEVKQDPESAKEKYAEKVLRVSGPMIDVSESKQDPNRFVLRLQGEQEKESLNCYFEELNLKDSERGRMVQVQGTFAIENDVPILKDCSIVERKTSRGAVLVSANELARAFAENAEQATKQHQGKQITVSGLVQDQYKSVSGTWKITLRGEGGVSITCVVAKEDNKKAEQLKVGQAVTFSGKCDTQDPETRAVRVIESTLVETQ